MDFFSTKTYTHSQGLSCCFRQWRADSHCRFMHGYALQIKLTFKGELDERNWVQDFGGLKPVKAWLEDTFDHTTLIATDDPEVRRFRELDKAGLIQLREVLGVGCEMFAKLIFQRVSDHVNIDSRGRVSLIEVEVREHEGNSAICRA